MKKWGKEIGAAVLVVIILTALASLKICPNQKEITESFTAMDTIVTLKLKGKGSENIIADINEFVTDYDYNVISRHSSVSEMSKINGEGFCSSGSELYPQIKSLYEIYKKSEGAFDFTLGCVSDLWQFGESNKKIPTSEELNKALENCGADKLIFSEKGITFPKGLKIDFGASGKGIALDLIRDNFISQSEINRAVISLGGSVLLYGKGEFKVGITNPLNSVGYMAKLKLTEGCVSTSGSYERYFIENGVRYHHILNPENGYPVNNGLVSVTVVSESGLLTDALSTACFVLGTQKGKALLEEYGCEGVFIDTENNVFVTEGLKDKIEITDKNFSLI